jgi:hypothetical protein
MATYYMRRGVKKRMPEPCLCGDPYCPQCFPSTWQSNLAEDFAEEEEEENEDGEEEDES